jgi:hypothetical protein
MPVLPLHKRGFHLACGRSKCGPEFPEDAVPLAGTDCDDEEAVAARGRLESLLSVPREFAQLLVWETGGKGWELLVDRRDLPAARVLALGDALVRPYVYSDR